MKKVKIKIKLRINFQPLNYQQDDSAADFSADALAVQSLFFAVTWEGSVGVLVSIPTDCSSFHLGWAVIDFFQAQALILLAVGRLSYPHSAAAFIIQFRDAGMQCNNPLAH